MKKVSVLIPTFNRPQALAVTLAALSFQDFGDFDVLISDQGERHVKIYPLVSAMQRLLEFHGHKVKILTNFPRRGLAHQRQFLLGHCFSRYCLFLDDDVVLQPWALANMAKALQEERCGFVGNAVIGLSFKDDIRPAEQAIEFWEGGVKPERVHPQDRKWQRYKLHNAANLLHVADRLKLSFQDPKKYKVAWIGGCVLYDTKKLVKAGGFSFWKNLPQNHTGEDVLAQLRVMEKYGGCGLVPSGAFHLELPTTIKDRRFNAPEYLLSAGHK